MDFVIAGNVARDIVPGGWRAGGTVLYAGEVARGLGRRVGIVTAATADVAAALPPAFAVVRHPAAECTTMENVYTPDGRVQYLRAAGESIPAALLPEAWTGAQAALLGPLYHEVDAALAARFRGLVGVCAQGFLRRAGPEGRVCPIPAAAWDAAPVLRHARVLFLSEEDIGPDDADVLAAWAQLVPVLVVTDGPRGARVHAGGEWRHVPAIPSREVDPTGAGDSFAAGFLVAMDGGADAWAAARFGAAAASFVIETAGPAAPTRAAVEARLAAHPMPAPT